MSWDTAGYEEVKNVKIKQTTFAAMRILGRIHKEEVGVVTSKKIAEKEELSQGVTLRILRELSHAGIVQVHQGRGQVCGGFSLTKSIDDITLADIMVVLEGMDIGANLDEASREKEASLHRVCDQIDEYLEQLFSRYSIRQMLESGEESMPS